MRDLEKYLRTSSLLNYVKYLHLSHTIYMTQGNKESKTDKDRKIRSSEFFVLQKWVR